MFVTHDKTGKVTAYSDKPRSILDLKEDETEIEVDMDFQHVACEEGSLKVENGKFTNHGEVVANIVVSEVLKDSIIIKKDG